GARALGGRKGERSILTRRQRDQDKLLSAEFGGDAHGHLRLDAARRFCRKAGTGTDHRRDERMEGENRRRGKSRQHRERLAVYDGRAKRLSALWPTALDDKR